jgi:hypothetical protein
MLRNEVVFHYHYLRPEKRWGVFKSGEFIRSFEKLADAQAYCAVRNQPPQGASYHSAPLPKTEGASI